MEEYSNTKICPYCAEEIQASLDKCIYCQTDLDIRPAPQWYRSSRRKILAGVCKGLADHFNLPVLSIRMAFIIATIFGGWGLFFYISLWFLMPLKED